MKVRLIEKLANRGCITINKGALISELMELMNKNKIRHIPIIEKKINF